LATTISPNQSLTFRQLQIYYQESGLELNQESGLELNDQFLNNLDLRLSAGEFNYYNFFLLFGISVSLVSVSLTRYFHWKSPP
jgi:hypothetical protein